MPTRSMHAACVRLGWQGRAVDSNAQWVSAKTIAKSWKVEELLAVMVEESDAALLPWYTTPEQVAKRARLASPPARDKLIDGLREAGFGAGRAHAERRGVKTSASLQQMIELIKNNKNYCL